MKRCKKNQEKINGLWKKMGVGWKFSTTGLVGQVGWTKTVVEMYFPNESWESAFSTLQTELTSVFADFKAANPFFP